VVRLRKLYEDEDVVVFKAPTDEELEKLVVETIKEKGRPLSWKELRQVFSGIAGEDRLRKVLIKLIERDQLIELPDGTFGLPGMELNYVPSKTAKRVRPLVPTKFRRRWGTLASKLRKSGKPLGEALKEFEEERMEHVVKVYRRYRSPVEEEELPEEFYG